jgi:hypothetical protein
MKMEMKKIMKMKMTIMMMMKKKEAMKKAMKAKDLTILSGNKILQHLKVNAV